MEELVQSLLNFLFESQYSTYTYAWVFACGLFTALAPEKWQEKIPNPIMIIINCSALNFGKAQNKLNDLAGNPK